MTFNKKNFSKATFKAQITRKQSQFNRFCKRFQTSKNPVEKSFLKNEAAYIVEDLKTWAKQWMSCGFGPCGWITRNFTMANFNSNNTPSTRKTTRTYGSRTTRKYGSKTTSRKRNGKRSYARRSNKTKSYARRNRKSSYARRTNSRKSNFRRSYVAW